MSIVSIQSHVCYGHVGNSAAVFPMQRLGYEVIAINTVEFSNHTGYGSWKGRVLGSELVSELVKGLEERAVLNSCSAILSGYLGDADIGEAVLEAVKLVKSHAPRALYCCDPVMGDYGRGFFVRKGIPEILKEKIMEHADILTPNQFELEALTGVKISNPDDARRACAILHESGPKIVLVTSYRDAESVDNAIDMLVSDSHDIYRIRTPELSFEVTPNGAGDLSAALFLCRYLESNDAALALQKTAASVFGVMKKTYEASRRELDLIAAQEELVHPSEEFSIYKL